MFATERDLPVALWIDTPALGDTIAAIPTLRKLSKAFENKPLTVFTSNPSLFDGHPLVYQALHSDEPKDGYKLYHTFWPLVGKTYDLTGSKVEFRHSNTEIRQFHAMSLGFSLTTEELETDLYCEEELDLGIEDYVLIHPTHTWPTRTWEQAKWQELVDRLNAKGIPVVAVGKDSAEVGTFSVQKPVMNIDIKVGLNLLNDPRTNIAALRWMMNHKAKVVVTMDSGILHVAGTTDVDIIQLGSSIDPKLRAPWRKGSQDYKYQYVAGGCDIFCSSNMRYNSRVHGSIHGVPPQINCLEDKTTFECHPTVDQVFNQIIKLYSQRELFKLGPKLDIDPSRIAIMSIYNDAFEGIANYTIHDNFKRYCNLHGYSLEAIKSEGVVNGRTVHWDKLHFTKELLNSGKYDYVFFIDADCLFMDMTKKIEHFIDQDHFLWIANHDQVPDMKIFNGLGQGLISAQFLFKRCEDTFKFIDDVLAAVETIDIVNKFDYEQRQFRISANKPEFKQGVKVFPENYFNTFWYNDSPFVNYYSNGALQNIWKPGDFIVHVTGSVSPMKRRIQVLSDLSFFAGGHLFNFEYVNDLLKFKTSDTINGIEIQIQDTNGTYKYQFDKLKKEDEHILNLKLSGATKIHAYIGTELIGAMFLDLPIRIQHMEKAYITHTTENYDDITLNLIRSIKEFSNIPTVVFTIDYDASEELRSLAKCIRIDKNLPNLEEGDFINTGENIYVNRSSYRTYMALSSKIEAMIEACDFIQEWVYLDGDCIVNSNIDDLFNYPNEEEYPLATKGPQEYVMFTDGDGNIVRGNPFSDIDGNGRDNTKSLEWPLMEYFNMQPEQRSTYYKTTNILLGKATQKAFLLEWQRLRDELPTKLDHNYYLPFHEETIYNVLVWGRTNKGLPMVYINVQGPESVEHFFKYQGGRKILSEFYTHPGEHNEIKVFHGEKRKEQADKIVQIIKNRMRKKRLLYIAPHLSTGGMPQFLQTRVEAMLKADEYEVFVLEYNQYATEYVVQRNRIQNLLGDRFFTIAHLNDVDDVTRGKKTIEVISQIKPDLIHIEESPEAFDSFNRVNPSVLTWLYDSNHDWRIIETCHNIWFNSENKEYMPDGMMYCTPYHPTDNFKRLEILNIPSQIVTYPLYDHIPSNEQKLLMKQHIGMDPNKIHVLNIGLWTSGKNQAEGVEIARIAEEQFPGKFQFHFVGNQAPNFQEYWQPVMQNLPANVKIWGERGDTKAFMVACDAFMFNSTWECSPLALREAISHGMVTFSRNLPQYLDTFTPYIIPFSNDLTENASTLIQRLTGTEELFGTFTLPKDDFARFQQQHLHFYGHMLSQPKGFLVPADSEAPEFKGRLEHPGSLRLHVDVLSPGKWSAEFYDMSNDELVHRADGLQQGHWYGLTRRWHTDWLVKVLHNGKLYTELQWTLEDKECYVQFETGSLGDTLSWYLQPRTGSLTMSGTLNTTFSSSINLKTISPVQLP